VGDGLLGIVETARKYPDEVVSRNAGKVQEVARGPDLRIVCIRCIL